MKSNLKWLLLLAILLPAFLPAQNSKWEIMPVDQIRKGMKGYGLTVFEGEHPVKFDVEIIGVLHNYMPKQSMILARVSGHGLEESGVIGGMSGSPIIIEGKLIGALAYAWAYVTKPIAGITPIENMLEDMRHPLESKKIAGPVKEIIPVKPAEGDLVPVISPLMVSGIPFEVMGDLKEMLAPYNLVPVRSGGAKSRKPSSRLEPGSAIGVTITRGDIDMSAIGTVTDVIGNQVLAFGHPFLNGGQVSFPMTAAEIITVLPSLRISTKMGIALGEVGRLVQDRQGGIFGIMGEKAPLVPVTVHISNPLSGFKETYNMEMVWHTSFSPKLMNVLVKSSLLSAESSIGENMVTSSVKIKFEGYPLITLDNAFFNSHGPYNKLILEPVSRLIFNPFEEVRIESLEVDLSVDNRVRLANITRIWMEEERAKPGGTIHLHVMLRPFEGEEIDYPVEIEVPKSWRSGKKFLVGVAGGRELMPPVAPPVDFEGYTKIFTEKYRSTDLVVVQQMPTFGGVANGFMMENLPSSAVRILGSDNSTGVTIRQDIKFTSIATDWLITGKSKILIRVE